MEAKYEISATGSYEDAIKVGQEYADIFAQGASNISIKATRMKKKNLWTVILKYTREEKDRE